MTRPLWGIALAFLMGGCASTETHRLRLGPPHEPTASVPVLTDLPTRPYTEGGFVQVFGYGAQADGSGVAQALASAGAAMGCDALVRVRIDVTVGISHGAGVCLFWAELPEGGPPATKGEP